MKPYYPLRIWATVNFLPFAIIVAATLFIEGINVYGLMFAGGLLCYTIPISLPALLLNKYLCRRLAESTISVQTAKVFIIISGWFYVALVVWILHFFLAEFGAYVFLAGLFYGVLQSFAIVCFKLREPDKSLPVGPLTEQED